MNTSDSKLLNQVRKYFSDNLKQGKTLIEISKEFKQSVLPHSIKYSKDQEIFVRQAAQLIHSQHLQPDQNGGGVTLPRNDFTHLELPSDINFFK